MSSAYTTFRTALTNALSATLTGYTWQGGPPPSGRVPDNNALGFVWCDHAAQDSENKLLETITAGVRMYVVWAQRIDANTPIDPSAIEQAAADLQTTLAPASFPGDPWFFEVRSIDFDHDNGYIEAEVAGTRWNDAAVS